MDSIVAGSVVKVILMSDCELLMEDSRAAWSMRTEGLFVILLTRRQVGRG